MLLAVTEAPEDAGKEEKPSRASDLEERRKLPDVDECLVGAADLNITGCNLRPAGDRDGDPSSRLRILLCGLRVRVLLGGSVGGGRPASPVSG